MNHLLVKQIKPEFFGNAGGNQFTATSRLPGYGYYRKRWFSNTFTVHNLPFPDLFFNDLMDGTAFCFHIPSSHSLLVQPGCRRWKTEFMPGG